MYRIVECIDPEMTSVFIISLVRNSPKVDSWYVSETLHEISLMVRKICQTTHTENSGVHAHIYIYVCRRCLKATSMLPSAPGIFTTWYDENVFPPSFPSSDIDDIGHYDGWFLSHFFMTFNFHIFNHGGSEKGIKQEQLLLMKVYYRCRSILLEIPSTFPIKHRPYFEEVDLGPHLVLRGQNPQWSSALCSLRTNSWSLWYLGRWRTTCHLRLGWIAAAWILPTFFWGGSRWWKV